MHVPFSYVRCPSCGSTFDTAASIARLDNGIPKPCLQTDQDRTAGFMPAPVLHSWKDIAAYVGRGVRTTQRWEHDLGLPVHRPKQRERSAVLAFPEEINEWLRRTPVGLPPRPALSGGERMVHGPSRALHEH